MTSWGRLPPVALKALAGQRLAAPFGVSRLTFRVWPQDMDLNIHMTNSRYLAIMDLGRLDLIIRMRALRILITRHWAPVLSTVKMQYRRPLGPFCRYALESNIVAWTDYGIFLEHRFLVPDRAGGPEIVAATAQVRTVFLGSRPSPHKVLVADLMASLKVTEPSPPLPPDWG